MLKVPYIFICEGIKVDKADFSPSNIFDRRIILKSPTFLENISLVIGLIGDKDDDQKEFTVKIRGKIFNASLPPLKYEFKGYDEITIFQGEIDKLPVSEDETIYFEVFLIIR
ncbi:acetyl-CoA acetyltransferase [Paenibacillus farraposensis]|uniref:acetyl-CoA acetyltransferase n=1 Tax=Paenibacillus farraposensis TaxID=2807095 RepID=UPI003615FB2A